MYTFTLSVQIPEIFVYPSLNIYVYNSVGKDIFFFSLKQQLAFSTTYIYKSFLKLIFIFFHFVKVSY